MIKLFNPQWTAQWSLKQKQLFIRIFYHLRGHFDNFLWYMGSFAPDYESKEMILDNVRDEFGKHALSHERLYLEFAKCFGVDLTYELLEETYYLPFAKNYIKGQLRWLRDNDWNHQLTGFAAIERLDNVDYVILRDLAISIGAKSKALTFFNVHINADHFDSILNKAFYNLWTNHQDTVKHVFSFIADFHIEMWKNLSNTIFTSSG